MNIGDCDKTLQDYKYDYSAWNALESIYIMIMFMTGQVFLNLTSD